MIRKQVRLVALTLFIAGSILTGLGLARDAEADSTTPAYPAPESDVMRTFRTVDEASALVPFAIRQLAPVPDGFTLASVSVNSHPVKNLGRNLTTVQLLYRSGDGRLLCLVQRDAPLSQPARHGTINEVNGMSVFVATEENRSGEPVGVVSWQSGGFTMLLVGSRVTGTELIPLVAAVS